MQSSVSNVECLIRNLVVKIHSWNNRNISCTYIFCFYNRTSGSKNKKTDTNKEVASKSTQNADTASLTANEKDSKKQDTKITYENFLNIKMGQSYEDSSCITWRR